MRTSSCDNRSNKVNKAFSCITDINQNSISNRQKIKCSFMEHDKMQMSSYIKDLEGTIAINKQLIDNLIVNEIKDDSHKNIMLLLNQENTKLNKTVKMIVKERDSYQTQLLISEQIVADLKGKEDNYSTQMEHKHQELLDQLNRKEYILQYTQRKLSKIVSVLKKYAKTDDEVKAIITALNLNVKDNETITNVVEQNAILITEIQTTRSKMAAMELKISELTKHESKPLRVGIENEPPINPILKRIPPHPIAGHKDSKKIIKENNELKGKITNLLQENNLLKQGLSDIQDKNEKLTKKIASLENTLFEYRVRQSIGGEVIEKNVIIKDDIFDGNSTIKKDDIIEFLSNDY